MADDRFAAPPVAVVLKGWFGDRRLTYAEAEAYHLREAARWCQSPFVSAQVQQAHHLLQAERNRAWAARDPRYHRAPAALGSARG